MEPPFFGSGSGGNTEDEALRWLDISKKLLTSRDLMGSKSFATRARDADPQLVPAHQILAVVDTLISSEKRINNQLDWYLILQVQPNHDSQDLSSQYRRLAYLLNPQKNQLPFADQAFRLVVEAWSVLSNISRKRVYDSEVSLHSHPQVNPLVTLDLTGQGLFGQNNPPLQQQQQQQPQGLEFQFQINNASNNANGNPIMPGLTGMFMGSSSGGQMQNVGNIDSQNVGGQREEDGMGNAGGFSGNNVWISREDGTGGTGNLGSDLNNDIGIDATFNVPIVEEGVVEDVGEDHNSDEPVLGEDDGLGEDETSNEVEATFWTACPYCYHMFEFQKVYVDCTLRCQKCRKAFHGVEIVAPPPIVEGEESYFCCWGYMPLAVTVRNQGTGGGGSSNWTPFSPMFTSPQKPGNMGGWKSNGGPRFYHDDDDVYVEVAGSNDESDEDWQASARKKKT